MSKTQELGDGLSRQTRGQYLCPGCKRENITTVGWIKANDVVHCAGCGKNITLQRNNLRPKLEKAEKAIDAFLEEIRNLGKRI